MAMTVEHVAEFVSANYRPGTPFSAAVVEAAQAAWDEEWVCPIAA